MQPPPPLPSPADTGASLSLLLALLCGELEEGDEKEDEERLGRGFMVDESKPNSKKIDF